MTYFDAKREAAYRRVEAAGISTARWRFTDLLFDVVMTGDFAGRAGHAGGDMKPTVTYVTPGQRYDLDDDDDLDAGGLVPYSAQQAAGWFVAAGRRS